MNLARVLLGGLAAGVVLNIGEFVLNEKVLGAQMKDFMAKHLFAQPGGNFIAMAVSLTFVLAIVMVWLYALIRPRLGAGPKTAIVAALIVWFTIYFYSGLFNMMLFGIPLNTMLILWVWGLVEYSLAALVGGAIYKEA